MNFYKGMFEVIYDLRNVDLEANEESASLVVLYIKFQFLESLLE